MQDGEPDAETMPGALPEGWAAFTVKNPRFMEVTAKPAAKPKAKGKAKGKAKAKAEPTDKRKQPSADGTLGCSKCRHAVHGCSRCRK